MKRALLVAVMMVGCGGGGNRVTGPSNTPTPTPAPTPQPGFAFGDGQQLVGSKIAAGRYFNSPRSGCYWERLNGLGGTVGEINSNAFIGFDSDQWIVDIASADVAFNSTTPCGDWFTTVRAGAQSTIRPGVWLVKDQIATGTYTANVASGCYWERLRNFDGSIGAIISNDFISTSGSYSISIKPNDAGFHADAECGTWAKSADGVGDSIATESITHGDIERNREEHRRRSGR